MIDPIKINSFAVELRREWDLNSFSPINLLSIMLSKLPNLTIVYYPMSPNTSGMCIRDINGDINEDGLINLESEYDDEFTLDYDFNQRMKSDMIIGINSKMSKGRQSFTLAHELYHLLFEDNSNNFVICEYSSESDSEKEANKFASYLLIPYEGLERYVKSNNIKKWTLDDVIAAEQYFQISHHAMLFRLVEQGFITEEERDKFKRVKISYEAKLRGFNNGIYFCNPQEKLYYCLGKYVRQVEDVYTSDKISDGKRNELLLDAFRGDLIIK